MDVDAVVALALKLLGLAVDLVGPDNAKALLSPDVVSKANALADAAEYVRFGKSSRSATDAAGGV